jgi:hypothetical protein
VTGTTIYGLTQVMRDEAMPNQGTDADRLSQLADLRRQGVLSDEEYLAATARVVDSEHRAQDPKAAVAALESTLPNDGLSEATSTIAESRRESRPLWKSRAVLAILLVLAGVVGVALVLQSGGPDELTLVGT